MYRELLHIWGPFSINSFGLFVAIGVFITIRMIYNHPIRKKYLTEDRFYELVSYCIIACLLGGRLLYAAENWRTLTSITELFAFWQGGFSILGSIICCLTVLLIFLWSYSIPILPVMDTISLYAPIAQGFGRIGCFFAGCCFGAPCSSWIAITYTDPTSFAPLHMPIYPSQLFGACIFFCVFFILRFAYRHVKPGQLCSLYLILSSAERFFVDFWRAHREFSNHPFLHVLSLQQWIALGLCVVGCSCFIVTSLYQSYCAHHECI